MSVPDRSLQIGGGEPNMANIESMRNHSELFRAQCLRLISDAGKQCKRMQDEEQQLDQRLKDIEFLKEELGLKLQLIIEETEELTTMQGRVVKTLEASKEPLRVAVLCLEEREKRLPPERSPDDVDRELLGERKAIEDAASILQHAAEQMTEQIRLNRSVKYLLEKDLKEKSEAQRIDSSCAVMTMHSVDNLPRSKNAMNHLSSLALTPKQWENISEVSIAKAEQQKANSMSLRALVESLLEQTSSDMQKQVQATAAALQLSVRDIKSAKGQMEDELSKIVPEICGQRRVREDLHAAITETERARDLVQARLSLRHQRPEKELCHDPVQSKLLAEVQEFTANISRLRQAVAQSESEERTLVHCRLRLHRSIEVKANALYVDEVVCGQHRESVVIRKF
ncbi:tektin-1 [Nelusetta ayraudi]|uniref:tektin-1 n=1 Tax=Nelusetta ayraudi TaxID=303726 RepID=UPI003F6FF533